jgi:phosphate transport system substrate-binding protein
MWRIMVVALRAVPRAALRAMLGAAVALVMAGTQVVAADGNNALNYRGGAQGRVIFDGRTHAAKGFSCNTCHDRLFPTRRTGLIAFEDHGTNIKCFACHNGVKASNICTDCHRQPSN